jgi:regulator of replication initiation timing
VSDEVKLEMQRWSREVKERFYFEAKLNNFLKNEILRLEAENLLLRNENEELKNRIDSIYSHKQKQSTPAKELEID